MLTVEREKKKKKEEEKHHQDYELNKYKDKKGVKGTGC